MTLGLEHARNNRDDLSVRAPRSLTPTPTSPYGAYANEPAPGAPPIRIRRRVPLARGALGKDRTNTVRMMLVQPIQVVA